MLEKRAAGWLPVAGWAGPLPPGGSILRKALIGNDDWDEGGVVSVKKRGKGGKCGKMKSF